VGARPRRRRRSAPRRRLRRWLRRQDRLTRGLAIAVVALSLLVLALIIPRLSGERREQREARNAAPTPSAAPAPPRRAPESASTSSRPRRSAPAAATPKAPAAAPRAAHPAAGPVAPRAAIVIDDLGRSLVHLEQLTALGLPLSIAVIPGLPATGATAGEAARRGIELLLHQPMEPREESGKNPGEGVLLTSMTAAAIRSRVRANLAAVPGAVGVNNHMGSRFTEDAAGLEAFMAEVRELGLFWLDSRTTSSSRGVETARAAGVPAIERDVFIDAEVNVDFIRGQVRKLIAAARVRGAAVGIGHPHPETIAVLREMRGELLASGVTLVPVSALVRTTPAAGPALAAAAVRRGRGAGAPRGGKTATP
jgi:hypothetical protein